MIFSDTFLTVKNFLRSINPLYRPSFLNSFRHKKYITLTWFKGYRSFDIHFWPKRRSSFLDGVVSSKEFIMFGVTIFYARIELFIEFNHTGPSWEK